MEISLVSDKVTVTAQKGLGLLHRQGPISNSSISLSECSSSDQATLLQISSPILDALAPPPVKPSQRRRSTSRTVVRKKRRTGRSCDGDDGGEEYVFFLGGGDGLFGGPGGSWGGGGGGSGGGKGWNFDRFGGQNWDESSSWFSSSSSDFAFGFIYEVIYWIALSNCVHFAFKKIVRILTDGMADGDREKVPVRLAPV